MAKATSASYHLLGIRLLAHGVSGAPLTTTLCMIDNGAPLTPTPAVLAPGLLVIQLFHVICGVVLDIGRKLPKRQLWKFKKEDFVVEIIYGFEVVFSCMVV